jgi:Na+-translocating ferredoxin:NAD+ oxidoreductase RnfG subunit
VSEIIKSIIMWTLLCLGAGAVAVFSQSYFRPLSAAHETMKFDAALRSLFAPGVSIRQVTPKKTFPGPCWIGKRDSVTVGVAFLGESRGPNGTVEFIAAIDTTGTIMGIKLVSERRIPGQGVLLEDRFGRGALWRRLIGETDTITPWFIDQFVGTNVTKPLIVDAAERAKGFSKRREKVPREENRISAFTGATISTRAIARDIYRNAGTFFQIIRQREQ